MSLENLPIQKTDSQDLMLMQSRWAGILNFFLRNQLNSASILKNVNLIIGKNVINHSLGQMMNGWWLVDQDGPANVYRSAPKNNLTLTLTSDAVVTVSIGVF